MFVGQGPSGLPEDRVVNTFHFFGSGTYAADQPDQELAVAAFYNTTTTVGPISSYLSPWVSRSAELRSYDLEEPDPRVPTIAPITLAATTSTGMPEEVAVCLSWYCDPPVTPRRRGRIYLGPLASSAVTLSSASVPSRPSPDLITAVSEAAERLIGEFSSASIYGLQVLSIASAPPIGVMNRVRHGYIDNALDTQRRRGPVTTARTQVMPLDA